MGKNRKLPFGYKMECGRVVRNETEAPWVKYMFGKYVSGASFNELTETMMLEGPAYDEDKPWNKHMIARILGDTRYRGDKDFPVIIEPALFDRASAIRSAKTTTPQKTQAQKILRRKCGFPVTPYIEREVLSILNRLAENPDLISTPEEKRPPSDKLDTLKGELEALLMELPVDEEQARNKLMELAAAMYESIDPREYETRRLRELFRQEQMREELDGTLIEKTVSSVLVDSNGNVKIKLKNDQMIGRGE